MDASQLIVLRGNSGSGKTSAARALRERYGYGLAWVSQDMLRREVLREHDRAGAANIGLIDQVARYTLAAGYHVVLDGILTASTYEAMLAGLSADHRGPSHFYYLDVSLHETLRRHETRPQRTEFSSADMRRWYKARDLLATIPEHVIPEGSSLEQTVATIVAGTGLLSGRAAVSPTVMG
jgi:predicted kinase